MSQTFETKSLSDEPDHLAPDGSEIRVLVSTGKAGLAHIRLAPGAVTIAVAHRTIDELWYVLAGQGRIWRRMGEQESIVDVGPGDSISLPLGTAFQFRAEGDEPFEAVTATTPPWPGSDEAFPVQGIWTATF